VLSQFPLFVVFTTPFPIHSQSSIALTPQYTFDFCRCHDPMQFNPPHTHLPSPSSSVLSEHSDESDDGSFSDGGDLAMYSSVLLLLSCLVLSCLALPCLLLSCLHLYSFVLYCLALSSLLFSPLVFSCLLLFCLLIFSCLVLSCLPLFF
jgi:hypothetical protein